MVTASQITKFLSRRLRKINPSKAAETVIRKHRQFFVDENIEQLNDGLTALGQPITPSYTRYTVKMKQIKGQPSNKVTLKDTGAFHRSFWAKNAKGGIQITARDIKTAMLTEKYRLRGGIFGVSEKNLRFIRRELLPHLRQEFINQMNS